MGWRLGKVLAGLAALASSIVCFGPKEIDMSWTFLSGKLTDPAHSQFDILDVNPSWHVGYCVVSNRCMCALTHLPTTVMFTTHF